MSAEILILSSSEVGLSNEQRLLMIPTELNISEIKSRRDTDVIIGS